MASQFMFESPGLIDQLILLGTIHPRDFYMSSIQIPILKLYGSNDGVASPEKVMANKPKLSPSAEFVRIDGANYSQFVYYGFQLGDNRADISREKQQTIILQEILNFIESE